MENYCHNRRFDLKFRFPDSPYNIVLVEPEIPQNTGNIARLSAATNSRLHLVDPISFRLNDRSLKRAGLDYWDDVELCRHNTFESFLSSSSVCNTENVWLFSTLGKTSHFDAEYKAGDCLIFGSEGHGLSDDILAQFPDKILQIPMVNDNVRSLNLANSVAVVLYEALRQFNMGQSFHSKD